MSLRKMKNHLLKYASFTEEELDKVLSQFEEQSFSIKEMLLLEGNIARYEYFIVKGCVRCFVTDYNGKEHNIQFAVENYWFGDSQSFVHKTPATYNFQAIENLQVLAIKKDSWDKLIKEIPAFSNYSRILFRNAMITQQTRIVDYFTLTAEQRYKKLLEHHPDFFQRISQKNIASYLGITPEFLSLLRKKASQK